MSIKTSPPRVFGILLTLLGAALVIGGMNLISMGDSYYFFVVGVLTAVSGLLMTIGKKLGAYTYAITLTVVVVWSFVEVGLAFEALLPRILIPILLSAYIFSSKIQSRLS